jgi:hypothetical protein
MPAPIRELLHFVSPISIQVVGEGEGVPIERVVIKGFASVATDDRSGDRTDPREFNIKEFMAAPTLLRNHKFWTDPMGNQVAVGRPLTMNAARLRPIEGNDNEWAVVDLKTKQQINTFPKEKVPSLTKTARGLFVTAEVTQPEVQAEIARGELGGMSWRGLVVVEFELDPKTNTSVRVLKDIDLYEISVVHIPDHNQSTFVVGKMVDGKFEEAEGGSIENIQLWKVRLEKTKFASQGMATEYLKAHNLAYDDIREDDYSYFAIQQKPDGLLLEKTVQTKMGDAFMLMAPPKEDPKPTYETSRLVAEMVDVVQKSVEEEPIMADEKKDQADATATDTGDVKDEAEKKAKQVEMDAEEEKAKKAKKAKAAETEPKTEEKKSVAEEQLSVLGSHVAGSVADALKPTLEGIAGGLATMGDGMKSLTETVAKMATGAISDSDDTETNTEKKEVEKSADAGDVLSGLVENLNMLTESVSKQQAQIVDIAKSAVALGESIPNKGVERNEKVEVEKSAEAGENPNSCLDSAFPWLME